MKKYKSTIDGEVFETFEEALDWLEQYDLPNSHEFIEEIAEEETLTKTEVIEENPEENPDEDSVQEDSYEDELIQKFQNYQQLNSTEKAEFIQAALGSVKRLPKRIKLSDFNAEYLARIVEKIKMGICPSCDKNVEQLTALNIIVPGTYTTADFPKLIIEHIRSKHLPLWKALSSVFEPIHAPVSRVAGTPNPENLSEDQSGILDDELFLQRLSAKTKECYELTEKERKRFFHLFKKLKETKK